MSYFIEHDIQESTKQSSYQNPDVSDFMSRTTQLFQLFHQIQQNQPFLQELLGQIQVEHKEKKPSCSKRFIEQLVETSKEELDCGICLEKCKEKSVGLICFHWFHKKCVVPWLEVTNTCPMCRTEFETDDPEYELQRKKAQQEKLRQQLDDSEEEWDPFYG